MTGIKYHFKPENKVSIFRASRPDRRQVFIFRPFSDRASYSTDLIHWGESELLLGVEDVPFATFKIGAAAPPG